MANPERDASLARQRRGFTVQASPFNAVKFDLALIVIVAVVLFVVHDKLIMSPFVQLCVLIAYGVFAMLWIIIKTRRVVARQSALEKHHPGDDTD